MHKHTLNLLLSQKTKTPFVKGGISYYIHKIEPFSKINVIEPKNEAKLAEQFKKLEKTSVTIVLDEKGRQFSSESFARTWETLLNQRAKDISFIVGGPHGFETKPRADITFSLSHLTYNHEIVPIVLLEQIYRAFSIAKGLPYHHA